MDRRIDWKKGSGEIVGFAMILPAITFVFCAIVAVAQVGLIKQKLEYTAYTAVYFGSPFCTNRHDGRTPGNRNEYQLKVKEGL